MPMYGYQCEACGHRYDHLQRLSEEDPRDCPSCGAASLVRELSAPQFRLKGGGWYETDFKGAGDKKRNLVESSSENNEKPASTEKSSADSSATSSTSKTETPASTT